MILNPLVEKIANAELEVLKVLWAAEHEMTIKDIRKTLSEQTDWEASTIKTLVYRLTEKRVIKADKRNVFYYTPAISEQEYNDYTTQTMIDKLYGGSAKNLVASLVGAGKLTDDDINELRSLFKVGD